MTLDSIPPNVSVRFFHGTGMSAIFFSSQFRSKTATLFVVFDAFTPVFVRYSKGYGEDVLDSHRFFTSICFSRVIDGSMTLFFHVCSINSVALSWHFLPGNISSWYWFWTAPWTVCLIVRSVNPVKTLIATVVQMFSHHVCPRPHERPVEEKNVFWWFNCER